MGAVGVAAIDDVIAFRRLAVAFSALGADGIAAERYRIGLDERTLIPEFEPAVRLIDEDEIDAGQRRPLAQRAIEGDRQKEGE